MSKNNPYFIAEIGPNHNGSVKLAFELLEAATKSGANCAKFQIGLPDSVYSLDSFKANYQIDEDRPESIKEMSSRLQLTRDDHILIHKHCVELGIDYSCTAFDLDSLAFLNETFNMPFLKIPSGEILSIDLLDYVASSNKKTILSTGMATLDEIQFAVDRLTRLGNDNLTILHCVSQYPADKRNLNLSFVRTLQNMFPFDIGYSDHSLGNKAIELVHAMGCSLFEKHFTLDKSLPGPDHRASATPDEFRSLVDLINDNSNMLGCSVKNISQAEIETRNVSRKSIVTRCDLVAGHILTPEDVVYKRPGTGFFPNQLNTIVGKKLSRNVSSNRVIKPEDIDT